MANPLMKKIKSEVLLKHLSSLTNKLSEEVRKEFGDLSEDQLYWQPDNYSWSIGQCLTHLNAYYRYYVPVFTERVQNSRFQDAAEFFQSSPLGNSTYMMVKLGKVKNVKRKLKSPKDYNPLINKNLGSENPIEEFLKFQKELGQIFEDAKKINLRKTKTSFSIRPIVKLRIGDAFQYIVYHCERHIEQAKKVKALPNFPKS